MFVVSQLISVALSNAAPLSAESVDHRRSSNNSDIWTNGYIHRGGAAWRQYRVAAAESTQYDRPPGI